jgi:eukaryotic-like serine/threonine-protein kinase
LERLIVRVEETESGTAVDHAFTRSPVRIGRSARNDLCLPQRFVSAWHGLIEFDARGARYTDLGSTNGTLIDGSPVEARTAVALEPGAEVAIGSLRFTLQQREGEDDGAPRPGVSAAEPGAAPGAVARHATGSEPSLPPGGITAVMRRLAAAPADDLDRAWRRVLVPGAVVGRFELVREVGRGSCGLVFEARDRQLGRLVAFKAVKPGRESQVMLRQELLQREAEAAAQLNHPNIVSLFDVGTCESGPYLIMELLRGENLRDRIRRTRMPLDEALEIAIDIAWALDHAHASSVVHRDLKPANVFLCKAGHVKVLDFGIAHVFGAGAANAIGTPAYMAPEQWRGTAQDARTDVFAAAATLAEMVTGRLPYRVTNEWSAVLEPGARPHLDAPGAPPQLVALLRRGLSPSADARPRDGHAWLAALLEIHEVLDRPRPVEAVTRAPPPAPPPPRPDRGDEAAPWARAWVVVLAAALLAAGVLAYLVLS